MKKSVSVLLAIVLLVLPLVSFAEAFTFRNGVTFGMTVDEIIECEGKEPDITEGELIAYENQKSAGKDCTVCYEMSNNKLVGMHVLFREKHSFDNAYIEDFESVDQSLTSKYGKANTQNLYSWKNSLYKDDPEEYGFAVSCGHLTIVSSWTFDNLFVGHVLYGDNFEISHTIMYKLEQAEPEPNTDGI